MPYFSILFVGEWVCDDPGMGLSEYCRREMIRPLQVLKVEAVAVLVEADTEEEAVTICRRDRNRLFEKYDRFDVTDVESPEKWIDIPDCTFKVRPTLLELVTRENGYIDLNKNAGLRTLFEKDRHVPVKWQKAA